MRVTLACPVACTLNCADNSGAKSLYIISTYGIHGRLNKLPSASIGDMVLVSVRKGKPEMRKKGTFFFFGPRMRGILARIVMQAVIVRQRRPWKRRDGVYIQCEGTLEWTGWIKRQKQIMRESSSTSREK